MLGDVPSNPTMLKSVQLPFAKLAKAPLSLKPIANF